MKRRAHGTHHQQPHSSQVAVYSPTLCYSFTNRTTDSYSLDTDSNTPGRHTTCVATTPSTEGSITTKTTTSNQRSSA